jgi:sialate O-acetylesterase
MKLTVPALFILLTLSWISANANIQLPKVLGDNMVLQRNARIPIWGWATKGEKVRIKFADKRYSTTTGENGKWIIFMDPMSAGGPYEMTISGRNKITLKNILIGEVWVCSGQSNMEFPMNNINNAQEEMASANYPNIRLFSVPKKTSPLPKEDLDGGEWVECTPANVSAFSAVGYLFGRNLHKELNIPIGLINSSWGGTVLETWASMDAVSAIPDFEDALNNMKKSNLAEMEKNVDNLMKEWNRKIENDDQGVKEQWQSSTYDDSQWKTMKLPQLWETAGLTMDGIVWFRKEIILDASEIANGITLNLGQIDDSDISFVNGQKIGETINQYSNKREYKVAPDALKVGKNIIAVKVIDTGGGGGIWGDAADLSYTSVKGKFSLATDWKYNIGVNPGENPTSSTGPNSYPTLLFNGMISPLLPYAVQGAIWYQGESNASRANQYETIFPMLINDWRKQWNNPKMPFLFVQLANYMAAKPEPGESEWAELRDAQSKTLSVNKTGMAVIIDIGEAKDIHPRNKQDVAYRLSLAARKIAYAQDIVYSGPTYNSYKIDGNKIIITFKNTGSGLVAKDKYGYLKGFAIAGEDKKFVWAKAVIDGDKVVVWSNDINNPVAVRYAWADNPDDANFYNKEGLPASPFRTDDWPGITQ